MVFSLTQKIDSLCTGREILKNNKYIPFRAGGSTNYF